jgi:hypothetical protein
MAGLMKQTRTEAELEQDIERFRQFPLGATV